MPVNLGIDFGTSYTKLGYVDEDGHFVNLLGPGGMLPSVVALAPEGGRLCFGSDSLSLPKEEAEIVRFFKIELKRNLNFRVGDFGLSEILGSYFSYLRDQYVAGSLPHPLQAVTVGVPNYFGLKARRMLLEAVRSVFPGVRVRLALEPVAALVGLLAEGGPDEARLWQGNILILDLGGGTADASFVHVRPDRKVRVVLEAQLHAGSDAFSGAEIDKSVLRQTLFPCFEANTGITIPPRFKKEKGLNREELYEYSRMLKWAEEVKLRMQGQEDIVIDIPSFYRGRSLSAVFEKRNLSLVFERTLSRLEDFINNVVGPSAERLGLFGAGKWDIDIVVLTGGVSKMQGVEEVVSRIGSRVYRPYSPEFSVIQGLCRWPGGESALNLEVKTLLPFRFYIEKKGTEPELDTIPFDTANLELDSGGVYRLFSVLPTSPYNLSEDNGRVKIRIYQGGEAQEPQEIRTDPEGLVLEESRPVQGDEPLEVWLDLAESCLRVAEEPELEVEGAIAGDVPCLWEAGLDRQHEVLARVRRLQLCRPEVSGYYAAVLEGLKRGRPFQNFDEAVKAKLLLFLDMLSQSNHS
ncbi:MAG TPA: Hsp70 family protein [Syntrophothermus lipocalidus]|nr:Hsp70 family protein [Syntrophothermus lipocalidus]